MNVDSSDVVNFVQSGGRIFHRREDGRTVTVAYRRENGKILYGATMFRPPGSWVRKAHNFTAVKRQMTAPVEIPDIDAPHSTDRENYIREKLMKFGVKNHTDSTDSGSGSC